MSRLLFFHFETPSTPPPPTWAPPVESHPYWGPHFPDLTGGVYWGPHFPDGSQSNAVVAGFGPPGVATFVLDLQDGFALTLSWLTDVRPRADGSEQRVSLLDRPKQSYDGAAILTDIGPRQTRARLAQFAALGYPFLLGLPHEGIPLVGDAVGTTLVVPATALALCDYKQPGQRVVVRGRDGTSVDAVIQETTPTTIRLNVDPGAAGFVFGWLMPAMAVLIEPQQNFDRYPVNVENWQLAARAAIYDFAPASAMLDLEAVTGDATLAGAFLMSRRPGIFGEYDINFANGAGASLSEVGFATTIFYQHGVTTLADVATMLLASDNVILVGTYNPAAVITIADEFTASLAGTDASGPMGTGAALTLYAGHPVWDRELANDGTNQDTVQAMTQILDLDGVPIAVALANDPQFGRTVAIVSDDSAEWQWLKLFLCTVRGPQSMFWLPTWATDLTWISSGVASIVVATGDGSDVLAWYPTLRDRLMIKQIDGTITYVQITAQPVDHGDGTQTLSIDATLSATAVEMISWLEPCRFETDVFKISFKAGRGFAMSTFARAHAASATELAETE